MSRPLVSAAASGDDDRGAEAGEGDDAHRDPDGAAAVGGRGRGPGQRHERRRVDQAEHEEGEADGTDAGAAVVARTTAMRTTSLKRPGRAAPVTLAAPQAAPSVSGFGRSCGAKSRCQP